MKIKADFMLRSVAGQNVVVPVGNAAVDFNGMINLNESGAFLWKTLEGGATEDELVSALLAEYDAPEAVARADVSSFVKKMREANLIDE
ncbi:MAG: PqqD family protein [Ruminococcaceae bacterium]|nr:PqqD family protein [Oscillospiraceae bacterium]